MDTAFRSRIQATQAKLEILNHDAAMEAKDKLVDAVAELSTTLEELRVADEELRQQNEELVTARYEAEEEGRKYRELFEHAPGGYLVTDVAGVIGHVNRQAAQMLGK